MAHAVHFLVLLITNALALALGVVITWRLLGEMDFGPLRTAAIKAGVVLLILTAASMMIPFLWMLGWVVLWLFCFMLVFGLPFEKAWPLALIVWCLGLFVNYLVNTLIGLLSGD